MHVKLMGEGQHAENNLKLTDMHLSSDGHWTALSHKIGAEFIKVKMERDFTSKPVSRQS
jgi:hypothetical protein